MALTGIKSLFNFLIFDTKIILKNKLYLVSIVFVPALSLILNIVLFPMSHSGAWTFFLATTIPTLVILVNIKNTLRRSTMYSNSKLTKHNLFTFYLESFIFYLILFCAATLFYIFFVFIFGDWLNLFLYEWLGDDHTQNYIYQLFSVRFSTWVFFILYYCLLNFSLFLFLNHFLKDKKTILIFVLIILLLSIPFGGVCNQQIFIDNSGDEFPIRDALNKLNYQGIQYDTIYLYLYKIDDQFWQYPLNNIAFFCFPWNGLNQFFQIHVIQAMVNTSNVVYGKYLQEIDKNIFNWRLLIRHSSDVIRMYAFILQPLIFILVFNLISVVNKFVRKKFY